MSALFTQICYGEIMKKLLGIVFLGLMLSGNVDAKVFNWTCLRALDKDFQLVFEIDDKKKIIKHLTSYQYSTKKKFEVLKKDNIIKFEKHIAWGASNSSGGNGVLRFYDFKNRIILQSGIIPDVFGDNIYHNDKFECFVSN